MKLNFKSLIMMLLGVSMASACNSLEVTMPVGPRGEQGVQGLPGKDGMSAYELWVKAVKEKTHRLFRPRGSHPFLPLSEGQGWN